MQNNSEAVNARIAGVRLVGALHPHLNNAEGRAFVRLLNKTFNICSIKNVQVCSGSHYSRCSTRMVYLLETPSIAMQA